MNTCIHFDVVQQGTQSHVVVQLDGRPIAAFNISTSDLEHFIAAFEKKPIITIVHGEPQA